VQTIVFLVIAIASAIGDDEVTMESIMKLRNHVRVYGDDIILPSHGYARLLRIMDLLQLKVNVAKSYRDGYFRESCGSNAYRGYDVTPVKAKEIVADGPTSCQAVIDTSNNLFCKGYWHASQYLISTLPPRIQRGLRIVGRNEVGYSGLVSFSGSDESHLVKRWNSRLHSTREGFGEYLQNLNSRPGESSSRFLTFCQGHTIRALLGLCRYTDELGRSLVIFYGSPLTWALTVILACRQIEWFTCLQPFKEEEYAEVDGKPVYRYVLPHEAVVHEFNLMNDGELNISDIELHEASTYFI